MSEMACDEEERNENHEDTERPAKNLHESVKGDMGMREIDSVTCDLSANCETKPNVRTN